jgi:hypothetical protein
MRQTNANCLREYSLGTDTMINAVLAVQAVIEARQRIPQELKDQGLSFFSINDLYHYFGLADDKLCDACQQYDGETLNGAELRRLFPFMEIDSENIIYPKVHPNCRCMIIRLKQDDPLLSGLE